MGSTKRGFFAVLPAECPEVRFDDSVDERAVMPEELVPQAGATRDHETRRRAPRPGHEGHRGGQESCERDQDFCRAHRFPSLSFVVLIRCGTYKLSDNY